MFRLLHAVEEISAGMFSFLGRKIISVFAAYLLAAVLPQRFRQEENRALRSVFRSAYVALPPMSTIV